MIRGFSGKGFSLGQVACCGLCTIVVNPPLVCGLWVDVRPSVCVVLRQTKAIVGEVVVEVPLRRLETTDDGLIFLFFFTLGRKRRR